MKSDKAGTRRYAGADVLIVTESVANLSPLTNGVTTSHFDNQSHHCNSGFESHEQRTL